MEKFKNMQDLLQQTLNKKMYLTCRDDVPEGVIKNVNVVEVTKRKTKNPRIDLYSQIKKNDLSINITLEVERTMDSYAPTRYANSIRSMFIGRSLDHLLKLFGYDHNEYIPIVKVVDYKTKEVLVQY